MCVSSCIFRMRVCGIWARTESGVSRVSFSSLLYTFTHSRCLLACTYEFKQHIHAYTRAHITHGAHAHTPTPPHARAQQPGGRSSPLARTESAAAAIPIPAGRTVSLSSPAYTDPAAAGAQHRLAQQHAASEGTGAVEGIMAGADAHNRRITVATTSGVDASGEKVADPDTSTA